MRKIVMLLFVIMMFSVLAVPAFAQTAQAHGSTNWVVITSGFAIAIAAGWRQGQGVRVGACKALGAIRRAPLASVALILGLPSSSRCVVHARDYFRESRVSEFVVLGA